MDDLEPGELDREVEQRLKVIDKADLPWVRVRIVEETAARRAAGGGCGDTLYALAFLLYQIGDPEDAVLIFEAKRANFDCGCTVDRDLLTMGRSIEELRRALDPVQHRRLLEDAADAISAPDHEDIVADLRFYFGLGPPGE